MCECVRALPFSRILRKNDCRSEYFGYTKMEVFWLHV